MPNLSPRENFLKTFRHEQNEYVPYGIFDMARVGLVNPADKGYPDKGYIDGFNVRWVASDSAIGGLIPEPGVFLLKDVTRWKKDITIPNANNYDWQPLADKDYATGNIDPKNKIIGFIASCGPWERLAALMGFEEAMVAMMEEPEATYELLTAITDFKIGLAEKAAKYYKADVFYNYDDIATERNLFMHPDTYRALIKPQHKRLNDAVRNFGMIPIQHTCGHAELCVEDYIETGADGWNAVQASNDLSTLLDKYGNKFVFEGGYDSTGKPGRPTASVDEVVAEVERCFKSYKNKKGWIFAGSVVASVGDAGAPDRTKAIMDTANRLRFA